MRWLFVAAAAVASFIGFALWYEQTPGRVAAREAEAARIAAERLPRKVNEAGGCEVWAFKPADRWLYFTRCGTKTETVTTWDQCRSVQQGKTSQTVCTPHSATIPQETR